MLEETDGDSDTVEAFNTDLRDLRSVHGNPPYKVLEERSYKLLGANGGVGKATLHNAVTDRALASERAVKALVMPLTGSPEVTEQWIQRRSRLAAAPQPADVLERKLDHRRLAGQTDPLAAQPYPSLRRWSERTYSPDSL